MHSFLTKQKDIKKYTEFFVDQDKKIDIEFNFKSERIYGIINKINNVEAAKKYVGKLIFISFKNLPKLKNNQFYFHDLIKLQVYLEKEKLGIVNDVKNHGAGDYIEIKKNQNYILVPLHNDHILKIDLKNKKIFLNPNYYEI